MPDASFTPTPVAKVRNLREEARVRQFLLMGLQQARFWALLTKTTEDDVALWKADRAVSDDLLWSRVADIIWGQ